MVNKAAIKASEKSYTQAKEESEMARKVKYKRVILGKKQPILHITVLVPFKWKLPLWIHHFGEKGGMKVPVICVRKQYKEKECKYCDMPGYEGKGQNHPRFHWLFLVYVHDYEGQKWEDDDGKKHPINPIRIMEFSPGMDEANFEPLEDAHAEKLFNKAVFQIKRKRGLKVKRMTAAAIKKILKNKGIVPKAVWEEVGELDIDGLYGHELIGYKDANFDFFGVPEPEIVVRKDEDDDRTRKRRDNEDSDEDEEEETGKKKRKNTTKSKSRARFGKKGRSKDESDDESDDDDEDEDDDDEDSDSEDDDDDEDSDDEEDDPDDGDDDEDDSEDDDDDEDAKPKKRAKKPVKKKPVKKKLVAKKKKSKSDEDEDEDDDVPDDDPDESDDDDDDDDDEEEEDEEEEEKPRRKKKVGAGKKTRR